MARDDDGRDRIELLVDEVTERCRRGESPSVNEYAARYPEYAGEIRELLPPVLMLEGLKRQKQRSRAAVEAEPAPATLGEFRIIREVGRGGMGIVYEAEHVALGRRVALKVLPRHSLLDPKRRKRFQREAQAAARLHHTNIVPVLGVGESDGFQYYVMQFIEGRDLHKVLAEWKTAGDAKGHACRWHEIARIGLQAAEALHYAHDQGILHRDIKPANLLLDPHEVVWVTDFGLAKLLEREDLTHTGDIIGTLQYMAPEQFEGRADPRSDVYSLGLTLFELLTLRPVFEDSHPSRLAQHLNEAQPPRPRTLNPAIPRDLETIVLKAIAREPDRRYATAAQMAEDLRRFLDDRPVLARRTTAAERLWRWCRRNRALAALSATAAASLLLAAAFGWSGYVGTRNALTKESKRRDEAETATRRADENVALSLAAFEDLFNKIASRDPDPPRHGIGGPFPRDEPPGPPPRFEFGRPPGDEPPGPPPGPRPNGPGFGGPPGPRGRPPRPSRASSQSEAELLQGILAFYDRFAAKNATNTHLQREAAKAFRRAGDLHRRLGQSDQADVAYRRAAALLEVLIAQGAAAPGSLYDLAETYLAIDVATTNPDAEEQRLRRALNLGEELAAELPDDPVPLELIAHAHGGLSQILAETGNPGDVEASLRRAVAVLDSLASLKHAPPHSRRDRLDARLRLAEFLSTHEQLDEAHQILRRHVDELRDLASDHPRDRPLSSHFVRLATVLRDLGEVDLAKELSAEAAEYPPPRNFDPRDPPPPPPDRPPPP